MAESIGGKLRNILNPKSDEAASAPARLTTALLPPDEAITPEQLAAPANDSPPQSAPPAPAVAPVEVESAPDAAPPAPTAAPAAPLPNLPPTPPLPTDPLGAQAYQAELQHKMTALAEDFSLGKINRQQFEAVYEHYREQRQIIESLITAMATEAWPSAVSTGQTHLLLARHASQVAGCALYHNASGELLAASPKFAIDPARIAPVIAAHRRAADLTARVSTVEIEGGRWLCFVPGHYSTFAVLFSMEPARAQVQLLQDLHHDFELASARRLSDGRGAEAAEAFMRLWALERSW